MAVKKSITVLGVEADGLRGVRLEEDGGQWSVADQEFWPTGMGGAQSTADESGEAADAGTAREGARPSEDVGQGAARPADFDQPSDEDRYAALVEALKEAAKRFGTHEVVLSMPLKSLLVKVSRTLVEEREHLAEKADEELGKVSPFPDESPVIGMEVVAETDRELVTVFAALPSAEAEEIGDALDEAKVRVTRTDITALGWLRTLWPRIFQGNGDQGAGDAPSTLNPQSSPSSRKVVLMDFDDGWDIIVLDESSPSLLRGLGRISDPAELGREVMLSLLRAGGAAEVGEIVVFSKGGGDPAIIERLSMLAPVRSILLSNSDDLQSSSSAPSTPFGGIEGVARRTQEDATLDVTPADWAELRTEARFTKKLMVFLAAAAAGWILLMGVLVGVPCVYGQTTERQKTISKRHAKAYKEVKEMQDKVKLVQQYSDHARGSLEMLKAVSDRMPEGITLTSFSYKRGERLSVAGEAAQPTDVYDFKNALTEAETEDGEKLFTAVTLTGPSQSRGGIHKFSIDGSFVSEEEGK